jgi:hypothetical protein
VAKVLPEERQLFVTVHGLSQGARIWPQTSLFCDFSQAQLLKNRYFVKVLLWPQTLFF